MAKQNFLGLVKFKGTLADYEAQKALGKLIFAEVTGENAGKYIYANGLEYKVADSTNLDNLVQRVNTLDGSVSALEAWKIVVDGSIAALDASVKKHEDRLTTTETSVGKLDESLKNHEDRITALENASTALADRIADVSQHAINIDASIEVLKAKDVEIDGSLGRLNTSVSELEDANLLKTAGISATAADNKATVTLSTTYFDNTSATDSFTVAGENYVEVAGNADAITVGVKVANITNATAIGEGLADAKDVKDYVAQVLTDLDQALKFISDVTVASAAQLLTTEARKAGDTFVASGDAFDYEGKHIEAGDLVIVKSDSNAGDASEIIIVERNLNGAVTAGAALATNSLVIGSNGSQAVETTNITVDTLNTAIANANSALQNVTASSLSEFVTVAAAKDASAVNVSVGVTTHDVSTAATDANGLATALGVKEYVDAQATNVKVKATLNSSTPDYVDATASVDEAGRVISASVGVKTATLANASDGIDGLATAVDVYTELTAVEQTITEANTAMSNAVGLNPDYSVTWTTESGISTDASIVKAIEEVAKKANEAAQSGVTEFGGKKGAILVDTENATDGSVKFEMVGSTLKGTVNGWSELKGRITAAETSIGNVSTRVSEVSTRLDDLSTYVRQTVDASIDLLQAKDIEIDASIDALQAKDVEIDSSIDALQAKDVEIDASIDRLDAAVSALESRTITGESETLSNANDAYVNVAATTDAQGNVTLDSSVQLATKTWDPSVQEATATGLATDAYVNNYVQEALLWEVIGD